MELAEAVELAVGDGQVRHQPQETLGIEVPSWLLLRADEIIE